MPTWVPAATELESQGGTGRAYAQRLLADLTTTVAADGAEPVAIIVIGAVADLHLDRHGHGPDDG